MELHQENLNRDPRYGPNMVPFTVYKYGYNQISINDNPMDLPGLFDHSLRTYDFVTYTEHRTGFDFFAENIDKK